MLLLMTRVVSYVGTVLDASGRWVWVYSRRSDACLIKYWFIRPADLNVTPVLGGQWVNVVEEITGL